MRSNGGIVLQTPLQAAEQLTGEFETLARLLSAAGK